MPSNPDVLNRLYELGLKEGEEIACENIKQLYRFSHGKFMFNGALSEQILVDNIKSLSNNTRYL
jgi:ferritin-like protein